MKDKSMSGTAQGRLKKAHPKRVLFAAFFLLMIVSVLPGFNGGALATEEDIRPLAAPPSVLQPRLTVKMLFTGSDGNMLAAGEKGLLVLTVVNEGEVSAENIVVDIGEEGENGAVHEDLSYERHLVVGAVKPHETVSREVPILASAGVQSREVILKAHIPGYEGAVFPEQAVRIQLKPIDLPRLAVSVVGVKNQDGDSRLEAGKIVRLSVRIQNLGTGNAFQVSAHVRTWRDVFVAGDGNTYFELGNIGAGKFVDVSFLVYTGVRTTRGRNIPVTVYVNEARSQFDVIAPLDLPFGGVPACDGHDEGSKVK